MKESKRFFRKAAFFLAALGFFSFLENNRLGVSRYICEDARIPESFSGFRLLQISDLHNKGFGIKQGALLRRVRAENPDIVVITGDLFDCRRKGRDNALRLVSRLSADYPVYFVPGNHESRREDYPQLQDLLRLYGATLLEDRLHPIFKNGETLCLMGLRDPLFGGREAFAGHLHRLSEQSREISRFCILLSHRPEWVSHYADCGIPLVLSGHAHGGQIRLPRLGALFAPRQGFFPKYTAGMDRIGDTTLIVSRGLGNSVFPQRIGNPPELVSVELKRR